MSRTVLLRVRTKLVDVRDNHLRIAEPYKQCCSTMPFVAHSSYSTLQCS